MTVRTGYGAKMEDAHSVIMRMPKKRTNFGYFGIFDGHDGSECAPHVANHFGEQLTKLPDFNQSTLTQCCLKFDQKLRHKWSGCAAIFTVVESSLEGVKLINANMGDSRTVLAQYVSDEKYTAVARSQTRKPHRTSEN